MNYLKIGSQNYQDKIQHLQAEESDLFKAVNLLDRYIGNGFGVNFLIICI